MRRKFEYKIFLKYFFAYLCAVAAFIMLIIPIYHTMYRVTKNNTIKFEAVKIYEDTEVLNSKIEKITTISTYLKNDANFLRLSRIEDSLSLSDYLCLPKGQEVVNDLRRLYDLDLYASVIFRNNNIFISESKTSPDYRSVYDHYLTYETSTADTLRTAALYSDRDMKFIPSQSITYLNGEEFNGLTCIVKVASKGYGPIDYAIIYTINVDSILTSLNMNDSPNEFLQITDNKGNILLNHNYNGEAIRVEGENIQDYTLNGEPYTLIHTKTEYGNLNVVKGIHRTVFDGQINDVLSIIQIYIVIAILLCFLISLILSFRQFQGIRQILAAVSHRPNAAGEKNEYKYIYSSVKELANENQQYEEEIAVIKNSMGNRLIEKMFLQGIYTEKEKAEFREYVGKQIEFFCVVSVAFVHENGEASNESIIDEYGKMIHYVKNRRKGHNDRSISINNGIDEVIALISMKKEEQTNCEKLYSFMQDLAGEVTGVFGQPVEIGISNIGFDISNVHSCYLQARRAIRQINDQLELPVNMAAAHSDDSDLLEEFNLEQQLFDLIITEESEAVRALFQRLNRRIKNYHFTTEQEIMQSFFRIRSPIVNARRRILKDEPGAEIPDYNDSDSVARLLEALEESAIKLCELSIEKKKHASDSVRKSVIRYIDERYADSNLCAGVVAEQFHISEKYVFKLVKDETELPFGKYVENLRMQKAKELLIQTELSASEIAKMVGFHSITTFYKAFNRVFGVAPIAWRESYKK